MRKQSKENENNDPEFSEVALDYLIKKVKKTFFETQINVLILKSYKEENKHNLESVDVGIMYSSKCDVFQIWNAVTKEFLIEIRKLRDNKYFSIPIKLLHARTSNLLEDYGPDPLLDGFLGFYHDKTVEEKLRTYFFYLSVIILDEFNLDRHRSRVLFYDDEQLIFYGEKEEYMDTELNTETICYTITIVKDDKFFNVVKIDSQGEVTNHDINLVDFFFEL